MSGLFGGRGNNNQPTRYTGLQLQTSAQGVSIPIVWGHKRVGTNLIGYWDFKSSPVGGKKGGKGGEGKGGGVYNYSAAVALALGEGVEAGLNPQGNAVGAVWQDRTLTTLANLGLTFFTGDPAQAAWSYLTSNHPSQALTYPGTAYLAASSYALGKSPNLPNHNFEYIRTPRLVVSTGVGPYGNPFIGTGYSADCNPADCVLDLLCNPQFSIGLSTSALDSTTLLNYSKYCSAQWLLLSPDLTSQEQCSQVIDRWAQLTNTWIFWSGPHLKFVPLADTPINPSTMGSVTETITSAVPLAAIPYYSFQPFPGITADGGVVFQDTGAAAVSSGGTQTPPAGHYGLTGNVYYFNAADAGRPINVTYTRGWVSTGDYTYTPNVTSVADFSYDYLLSQSKGEPPITVTRSDPADAPNHVKLEFRDRANAYNSATAEWKDQGLVDQFGMIDAPVTQAHDVCDLGTAQRVAQLIGQRNAYIRNTYDFKVGWEYGSWLEPGDIVTLTDPHIGISLFPVRVRTADEDDQGAWSVVAEEFPGGLGTVAGTQKIASPVNNPVNMGVDPGSVNPPAVFEPASNLTGGVPQLWIAASGGANWGGCGVYISFNGTDYSLIGTLTAAAAQGTTGGLPTHVDPDNTNTIAVDCTESLQVLNVDTSSADANAFRTLAIMTPAFAGSTLPATSATEIIAYGHVVTTGTYSANVSTLRRGLYGTTPQTFSSGAFFSALRLNELSAPGNSTLVYDIPPQYVGTTFDLKFCSFNKLGNAPQQLSAVTAYSYTSSGAGYGGGTGGAPTTPTGLVATPGAQHNVLTWTPNPSTDNVTKYTVWRATGLSQPFSSASQIGTSTGNAYTDTGLAVGSTYTYFIEAVNAIGTSSNSAGANCTTGSATLASPLTTKGDIFVHSTVDTREPIGADGTVLTADSTQATGMKWGPSGGSPLTTKGDLFAYDTANDRLPVGTDGQVLTADSSQAFGLKWDTPSSGVTLAPALVTGLILWYRMDVLDTPTTELINFLVNWAPNQNGMAGLVSGGGGKVSATQLNGHNVLALTGGEEYMLNTITNYTGAANTGPLLHKSTMFAVVNPSSLSGGSGFGADISSGVSGSLEVRIDKTTGELFLVQQGIANIGNSTSAVATVGSWSQFNYTYDDSTGAYAFRSAQAANGSGTNAKTISQVNNRMLGWGGGGGTVIDFVGSVAELIVYNKVLNGTEIGNIESYLHSKWGV